MLTSSISLSAVDTLLDPDNRVHLTTDEQLKALLDKLDMVTSMRTSGGRTKRIRLLRKEINALRQKISQHQQNAPSGNRSNGNNEGKDGEHDEEEVKTKGKKKGKANTNEGLLSKASNFGTGTYP